MRNLLTSDQLREALTSHAQQPERDWDLRFALQKHHCEHLDQYDKSELREYLSDLFWGGTEAVKTLPIAKVIDELVEAYEPLAGDGDGGELANFDEWKEHWLNTARSFVPED